jgi:hypothetical protein
MTTVTSPTTRPMAEDVLRLARRAWFRSGVRRRDRQRLAAELAADLTATELSPADVLGADPATTAREWARARGLTDRRLRLAVWVLPAVLAGVVASGAVLAFLADAFAGGGNSTIASGGPVLILGLYLATAVLAAIAIVTTAGLILHALRDETALLTAKVLAAALPVGGALATTVGVTIANALDFRVRPRTFVWVCIGVLVSLAVTMAVARMIAVKRHARRPAPVTDLD